MGRHRSCSSDRNSSDSRDSRKRHRRKRSRSRSERRRDIKEEKYERNSDDYRLNKHSRYRNNSSERYYLQLLTSIVFNLFCVGVYQNEKRNAVQLHHTIPPIGPIDENENDDDHLRQTKMLLLKMTKVILQL